MLANIAWQPVGMLRCAASACLQPVSLHTAGLHQDSTGKQRSKAAWFDCSHNKSAWRDCSHRLTYIFSG